MFITDTKVAEMAALRNTDSVVADKAEMAAVVVKTAVRNKDRRHRGWIKGKVKDSMI